MSAGRRSSILDQRIEFYDLEAAATGLSDTPHTSHTSGFPAVSGRREGPEASLQTGRAFPLSVAKSLRFYDTVHNVPWHDGGLSAKMDSDAGKSMKPGILAYQVKNGNIHIRGAEGDRRLQNDNPSPLFLCT